MEYSGHEILQRINIETDDLTIKCEVDDYELPKENTTQNNPTEPITLVTPKKEEDDIRTEQSARAHLQFKDYCEPTSATEQPQENPVYPDIPVTSRGMFLEVSPLTIRPKPKSAKKKPVQQKQNFPNSKRNKNDITPGKPRPNKMKYTKKTKSSQNIEIKTETGEIETETGELVLKFEEDDYELPTGNTNGTHTEIIKNNINVDHSYHANIRTDSNKDTPLEMTTNTDINMENVTLPTTRIVIGGLETNKMPDIKCILLPEIDIKKENDLYMIEEGNDLIFCMRDPIKQEPVETYESNNILLSLLSGAMRNPLKQESNETACNRTTEKQPDEPEDVTNEPLPSMSEPMEVQDAVASTLATPFAQPIIAASKSKAQKQQEYRQRIAATRTPAQAAAARKSKNERQRNNRLRQAANLAFDSGSLEATNTSSSRSEKDSNNVQSRSQRQHPQQQSTTTSDPLFPSIPVPMEVQKAVASTSATPFAEPVTVAPKTRAQIQREYRKRIAASKTPAQAAAAREARNVRDRNYRLRQAANLCKGVIRQFNS